MITGELWLTMSDTQTSSLYLAALTLVDDLRNEVYALLDAGQPVDDLLNSIFELEEELLQRSE